MTRKKFNIVVTGWSSPSGTGRFATPPQPFRNRMSAGYVRAKWGRWRPSALTSPSRRALQTPMVKLEKRVRLCQHVCPLGLIPNLASIDTQQNHVIPLNTEMSFDKAGRAATFLARPTHGKHPTTKPCSTAPPPAARRKGTRRCIPSRNNRHRLILGQDRVSTPAGLRDVQRLRRRDF